jgi:hypothetical protein
MPQIGFEPTIPMFEWAKTVHALDRAAIVIGEKNITVGIKEVQQEGSYWIDVSQDEVRCLGNVNVETALEIGLLRHNCKINGTGIAQSV